MNATSFSFAVWASSSLVLLGLLAFLFLFHRWRGTSQALRWPVLAVAIFLSGPAVKTLVNLWASAPGVRVVPGPVAMWTPAAFGLAAAILLWRLRERGTPRERSL